MSKLTDLMDQWLSRQEESGRVSFSPHHGESEGIIEDTLIPAREVLSPGGDVSSADGWGNSHFAKIKAESAILEEEKKLIQKLHPAQKLDWQAIKQKSKYHQKDKYLMK